MLYKYVMRAFLNDEDQIVFVMSPRCWYTQGVESNYRSGTILSFHGVKSRLSTLGTGEW